MALIRLTLKSTDTDRNKRPKTKRPDARNSLTYNPFIKPAKSQGYKLDYFITFYINIPTFFSYSFFKDTLTRKYLAGQRTLKNYSYSRNRVFFWKDGLKLTELKRLGYFIFTIHNWPIFSFLSLNGFVVRIWLFKSSDIVIYTSDVM